MKSIDEQLYLVSLYILEKKRELENNINCDKDYLTEKIKTAKSVLSSLESLKNKIDSDFDCFVAVMHKDDYQKFIEFKSIDKRPRELLVKRYGNRKKAINRFKSH